MDQSASPNPDVIAAARVIWGSEYSEVIHLTEIGNIFEQWSQGFIFSEDEPAALVQHKGGPCSVIAPVQAYILKYYLFEWEGAQFSSMDADTALTHALYYILSAIPGPTVCATVTPSPNAPVPSSIHFHTSLSLQIVPEAELKQTLRTIVPLWKEPYGVLCFLYSAVLSRSCDFIVSDMLGGDETLIDRTFGHGNQSLLNLMITGVATSNVFDHTKDLSGLRLVGVEQETDIGFLSILEACRYLKVGKFLKSPNYPIWILGSESHLTVLFTKERSLCTKDNSEFERARAVFDQFDVEGNGFAPSTDLPEILQNLGMFSEPEYVAIMSEQLDPDGTGIILFSAFLAEFFPGALEERTFEGVFPLHHYNGLPQSNTDRKVVFREGSASVAVEYSHAMEAGSAPTSMLRVLRTKWPTIEVDWKSEPSII